MVVPSGWCNSTIGWAFSAATGPSAAGSYGAVDKALCTAFRASSTVEAAGGGVIGAAGTGVAAAVISLGSLNSLSAVTGSRVGALLISGSSSWVGSAGGAPWSAVIGS